MRPVATLVAIIVLLLTAPLLAAPSLAAAAPAQLPDTGVGPLSLRLTQLEPRLVTAEGPQTLTVVGVLTNTGGVPVDELEIRVQRGAALGTEGELRDALDGNAGTDAVQPQFVPLPGEIPPGGSLPVRLAVLLRGDPDSSLALSAAGVYELLVNVNGVPKDGDRARLAAVRLLLPVLSLPPDATGRVAPAPPAAPSSSPFTLLYPIADDPHRLSTVPGEPTLLVDDQLAAALAPDGRLGELVGALAAAPVGSPVREATCLAIDPDLVQTAVDMRAGYQVVEPNGTRVPGTGAAVAGRWVDQLVTAARGGCVVALPFADADLVALNRGELGPLAVTALVDGRKLLAQLLGTPVLDQLAWPADGLTDGGTLNRISEAGASAVLLSSDGVEQGRGVLRSGVIPLAARQPPQFAVLTDPLLGLAVAGPRPLSPVGAGSTIPSSTPAGTATSLSTQDAIGALAFRARAPAERGGAPTVLAPPHQWAADGASATALLSSVDTLMEAGLLTPQPLAEVVAAGPAAGTPARSVSYPLRAGGREVVGVVAESVRATRSGIEDLRSAAVPNSGVGLNPTDVLQPLVQGMLRPMSAAWRGRPEAAIAASDAAAERIAELRGTVRVLEPPSPFTLGTSDAPLLVTIGNGLPFTVQVRLEISSTSGLRVAPIEMQQVPPLGRRQTRVNTQVTRSGQFTVLAAVRTPDGQQLGPPSRLRVRSTAYGTITVWLTASAGILLVVLAVRRVLRRVRGEPGRHAAAGPPPDPPDGPPPTDPTSPSPASPSPSPTSPISPTDQPGPTRPTAPDPSDPLPQPSPASPRTDQPIPGSIPVTERIPAIIPAGQQPPHVLARPGPRPRPRPASPAPGGTPTLPLLRMQPAAPTPADPAPLPPTPPRDPPARPTGDPPPPTPPR